MKEWRIAPGLSVRVYRGPKTQGPRLMTLQIGGGSGRQRQPSPPSLWKWALLDLFMLATWSFALWRLWRQGALSDPLYDLLLGVSFALTLYLRAKDWREKTARSPHE